MQRSEGPSDAAGRIARKGYLSFPFTLIFSSFPILKKGSLERQQVPKKRKLEGYPRLVWNQLLPGFLVPMFLLLTPFALSDQMLRYVYKDLMNPVKLIINLGFFTFFSLFAIWKLQSKQEPFGNIFVVFSSLWPQAFVISFLVSMLLHQPPAYSGTPTLLGVPWQVGLFTINNQTPSIYPIASLAFSVLCFFAAVFLEGLYRKG